MRDYEEKQLDLPGPRPAKFKSLWYINPESKVRWTNWKRGDHTDLARYSKVLHRANRDWRPKVSYLQKDTHMLKTTI